ncbi:hypothetical protein CJ739_3294 [Mariniflexile rhizosphaerae]|uniref:hypothetical protein n=1 Tax=unclassified Mariniflexile TaxID=2643887 RepID=UPI000CCA76C0|nr:hypothetical protein [Mariniflexile sp. TRM1-10]AXP82356.1 hypothetical protein CJ739_3294 [Mariniflexile sp. TRM1-10]PLB20456.1 MAG: hypothetical protein TRG1_804 [Flavobacteriaceae bacterium FS1-H7996/R]
MEKRTKRFVMAFFAVLILAVAFFNISDYIITCKLKNYLKNDLPQSVEVGYSALSVSSWQGKLILLKPKIIKKGNTSKIKYLQMSIDTLVVDGISYWDYWIHDKISIEMVSISNPEIVYNHNKSVDTKQYESLKLAPIKKRVEIETFKMTHSDVTVFNAQTDSLILNSKNIDVTIQNIELFDKETKNKKALSFESYQLSFENLFYQLNDFENVTVKKSEINNDKIKLNTVTLKTKYTKQKLSSLLTTERDHFNISIDSIELNNQDFGFKQDTLFFFHVPKTILYRAKTNIYRDKLVEDDPTIKPLYGEMLKTINFDFMLKEVVIKNSNISYIERAKADNSGGGISFSDFEATLQNVGNTYKSPEKTTINIHSNFMKSSPLKVDWSFDANDPSGSFLFSADLGTFQTNDINKFSAPNLHVRFEGEILKTYFTISGNASTSRIDLKTKYQEFDIIALRNDGKRKNKLISNILNIFVSKDSKEASDNFRVGSEEDVERDQTKSVFNFIWLNVKAGLLDAMTGSPKND